MHRQINEDLPHLDPTMKRRVVILNFHGVGNPPKCVGLEEAQCWIAPKFFDEIMDFIGPRQDVEITFDDANESDFEIGLPVLLKRGLTACFFVLTGRIESKNYLSSEQIITLHRKGMRIGSHGVQHVDWSHCQDSELRDELVRSRRKLEELTGVKVRRAACPFGAYNRRVIHHLQRAGYERVFTSDGGWAVAGSWISPRNSVLRSWNLDKVKQLVDTKPSIPRSLWHMAKLIAKRWR